MAEELTSNYYAILEGVENSIKSIASSLIPPTSIRYFIEVLDEEVPPLVIIAPGPLFEEIVKQNMPQNQWFDYVVLVAIITPGNRKISADIQKYFKMRELIRNQLFQPKLAGVPQVFDTHWQSIQTSPNNKVATLQNTNYKLTGWEMRYRTSEQRTS